MNHCIHNTVDYSGAKYWKSVPNCDCLNRKNMDNFNIHQFRFYHYSQSFTDNVTFDVDKFNLDQFNFS